MTAPPVEMSAEEFDSLKAIARKMERHPTGGRDVTHSYIGRSEGHESEPFGKGNKLALILRNGRYHIGRRDEYGFIEKILWREQLN